MGKLISPPELSLDFKPTFIPKTITRFLGEMSRIGTESEKIAKLEDLVSRFESEVRKIDAFKRELPLCMLLMNDAIAALKDELMAFKNDANQPVLEEFIPLKKTCEEDPQVEIDRIDQTDKRNWLSSTQLWNPIDNTSENTNQRHNPKQNSMEQVIQKIAKEEQNRRIADPCYVNSGLSLVTPGIRKLSGDHGHKLASYGVPDGKSDIRIGPPQPRSEPSHQQTCRKQRRCWSTELHRRFVNALQQLGGSKAATPKQIRELMRVDGLTNDEVKSHLQKYRLHTKRLSSNSSDVVSGGLWVPHHDQYVEMNMNAESGSPDGPLPNCATGGTSTTGGDSMDDGEDERSENNCWKTHPHTSGKNYV